MVSWSGKETLLRKKLHLGLVSASNNWFQNLGSFQREWDRCRSWQQLILGVKDTLSIQVLIILFPMVAGTLVIRTV